MDVGEVLQFYDSDKRFPAWGFGARPIDAPVSHCFNLNGSNSYSEVNKLDPQTFKTKILMFLDRHIVSIYFFSLSQVDGIQGIMTSYTSALFNVSLAGPTLFGPVINSAAMIASASLAQGSRKYYVLLIITVSIFIIIRKPTSHKITNQTLLIYKPQSLVSGWCYNRSSRNKRRISQCIGFTVINPHCRSWRS